ncbi:Capsular-polysaccharide-transporting ATPase [Sphingobium chlorophenolicum L-1]|uniref:Capsular-polysaccharide-transporting ATPase n=1 Tax=Sphingobium chlorophenolicum L-1 TaxID=690566 RepID=F6F0A7_SPHCR|nr:ABC transporter ATP-binding protein [Sphingobium chlorophenolicum]AEG50331.1 Capsular-polysaccharide-transporting ATPase [Sphingobium chlorophenolicum L-1]
MDLQNSQIECRPDGKERVGRQRIVFQNVSKVYRRHHFTRTVFTDLNFEINQGDSIGICGANGAGKSTLMRLIGGVEYPTSGKIHKTMTTSWPIGYGASFDRNLTGADNARFIARIYQYDPQAMLDYVEDFAQLGAYLHQPVSTYSAGMTARLAFGCSLAIRFDCYLIDEVTAAGDARFRQKSEDALRERRATGTLIMISHDPYTLQSYCTRGAVLYGGSLTFYDSVEEACEVHNALQMRVV